MMKHLKTLEGIRGLAAMYVLIHHARLALTQSYKTGYVQQPELYTWYNKVAVHILALFKFGNEAVLIFFVLSGFVIHLKHATPSYNYRYFSWKDFLKKRIIRIYPTLIASLLLCILIDFLIHLFYGISIQQLFSKYTIASLTFNLLLIPDSEAWGVNAPIWSLKHEWFFYLTYPVLLCLSSLKKYYSLFLVITLAISYFAGLKIPFIGAAAYTISIWFLGCILAETYQMGYRISSIKYPMVLIFLYFILR
ncbi:MAG: acyltransferase, partial [Chitinophagaceae bacterium]